MKSPLYSTGTISPVTLEHQTSEIPMNIYILLECKKVEKPTTLNTILQIYALTASVTILTFLNIHSIHK